MKLADLDLLILPGRGNSGPDHWQSRWEAKLSTARRVDMPNWDNPHRDSWVNCIVESVAASARPVVFIGHSLGCIALAHAAPQLASGQVKGAFLVAPATDARIAIVTSIDANFAPVPMARLPFPCLCVASVNDPLNAFADVEAQAAAWGAQFVEAGEAGHINVESGHGPWPEGLLSLAGFLRKL